MLSALARALFTTLDPDEVARRFDVHASPAIGGHACIWLLDPASGCLQALGEDPPAPRPAAADWQTALADRRPRPSGTEFLVPLVCDGAAIGLIQIVGASPADLATGGMRFWRALGETVGEAVANAQRHREAQASLRRFQALIEQMPAITYVDRAVTGEPLYVSPQIETIGGVPMEQWLDGTDGWSARVHPDDRERSVSLYRDALAAGLPCHDEYRLLDADGRERWFYDRTVIVHDESGAPVEVQGIIHEITDRKRAEEALHESEWRLRAAEARYRSLVEQLPLGIYVNAIDAASTPIYRSPATEAITGRSALEWIDDPGLLATVIHPDDRDRVLAAMADAGDAKYSAEYRILRPDGSVVWVLDESIVVRDQGGAQACRQGYLLDVTEHRRAEERLAHVAYHDGLTGLPNMAMFQEHLEAAVTRAQRLGRGRRGAARRRRRLQARERQLRAHRGGRARARGLAPARGRRSAAPTRSRAWAATSSRSCSPTSIPAAAAAAPAWPPTRWPSASAPRCAHPPRSPAPRSTARPASASASSPPTRPTR